MGECNILLQPREWSANAPEVLGVAVTGRTAQEWQGH